MKFQFVILLLTLTCNLFSSDTWTKLPLRFELDCPLETRGNMIRLKRAYSQHGKQAVMIEVEEASAIELDSTSRRIVKNDKASNGAYLKYVKYIEFIIDIKTAGKYNARILGYFPRRGNWLHYEQMDSGEKLAVWDSRKGKPGIWLWTKGQEYDLSKGRHVYRFPSPTAFCGGSQMDKIVLVPSEISIDLDKIPVSTQTMPNLGQAISKRLRLDRIKAWKLDYSKEPNGGDIGVEYSYNQKSWNKIESSKKYLFGSQKPQYLWLRFTLKSAARSGKSPWIQGISLFIKKDKSNNKQGSKDYEQIN